MSIFNWDPFNNEDGNQSLISDYIRGYKCISTDILAFHIIHKADINSKYDFVKLYSNLVNNYGIYFLLGRPKDENDMPKIYVGQASSRDKSKGMDRLKEHMMPGRDSYYDKWESAIFFTSKDNSWSTGVIDTLEKLFIECYKECSKYECLNTRDGKDGNVEEKLYKTIVVAIESFLSAENINFGISDNILIERIKSTKEIRRELTEKALDEVREELRNKLSAEDKDKVTKYDAIEAYTKFRDSVKYGNQYIMNGRIYRSENYNRNNVETPNKITDDMIKLLPSELFSSKTTFFNIACKTGSFIVSLIDRLMSDDPELPINNEPEFKDKDKRLAHIIEKQIYGLCNCFECYAASCSKIYEAVDKYIYYIHNEKAYFRSDFAVLPNIIYIDNVDTYFRTSKDVLQDTIKEKFGLDKEGEGYLKFDVVLGNPPYNKDLYLDFVTMGHQMSTKNCLMITPAKWQGRGGARYDAFREYIVPYMKEIVFYTSTKDVFDISCPGGITYMLLDKVNNETKNLHIRSLKENNFHGNHDLIISKNRVTYLNDTLENIVNKCREGRRLGVIMFKEAKKGEYMVQSSHLLDNKYYSNCVGGFILTPVTVKKSTEKLGQNMYALYKGDIESCKSFKSYVDTKLVRFLVAIGVCASSVKNDETWRFVPKPDSFDHIFTDKELYEKYYLADDEIKLIEKVVKERK